MASAGCAHASAASPHEITQTFLPFWAVGPGAGSTYVPFGSNAFVTAAVASVTIAELATPEPDDPPVVDVLPQAATNAVPSATVPTNALRPRLQVITPGGPFSYQLLTGVGNPPLSADPEIGRAS